MDNYLDRIKAMTEAARHAMFAAEKSGSCEKMENAAKDYAALCAAEGALSKQIVRVPAWGKTHYICPTCGSYASKIGNLPYRYCRYCGQKMREG